MAERGAHLAGSLAASLSVSCLALVDQQKQLASSLVAVGLGELVNPRRPFQLHTEGVLCLCNGIRWDPAIKWVRSFAASRPVHSWDSLAFSQTGQGGLVFFTRMGVSTIFAWQLSFF